MPKKEMTRTERTSQKLDLGLVGGAAESGGVGRRGLLDGWREQKSNFMLGLFSRAERVMSSCTEW